MLAGGRQSITANGTGRLFLAVNDDFFDDNIGTFRVVVGVSRKQAAGRQSSADVLLQDGNRAANLPSEAWRRERSGVVEVTDRVLRRVSRGSVSSSMPAQRS